MPLALRQRTSLLDYLAAEDTSPVRHEFVGGEIHAMTGGTFRHNRIAGNVFTELSRRFDGTPCQVFINDVKLHVAAADAVYYPDVFVHCGTAVAGNENLADDAVIVVEVLSDSTESIDRREKLAAYKRLPSLRAYLLISQAEPTVELHVRNAQGAWTAARYVHGETIDEQAIDGGPLTLTAIYRGTDLGHPG